MGPVTDFGLAALKKSNQKIRDVLNIPGSPIWLAPEVLLGKDIDETADIYAYGLCIWQLLTNSVNPYPFIKTLAELKREICQKHTRPPLDSFKEESIKEFLSACWHRLPDKRPSFRDIVHLIDHILVDIAISDLHAREFWKAKYLGKQQVEFTDFTNQLSKYFNIHLSEVQRHCLSLTIGLFHPTSSFFQRNLLSPCYPSFSFSLVFSYTDFCVLPHSLLISHSF